jgi:hypothetical protein
MAVLSVRWLTTLKNKRTGITIPDMPRNVALPFEMGSKNEIPPLAGLYGAMLGMRYDPVYTEFRSEGTAMAPEIRPGRAFKDPLFGIQSTDRLSMSGTGELSVTRSELELRRSLLRQFDTARRDFDSE